MHGFDCGRNVVPAFVGIGADDHGDIAGRWWRSRLRVGRHLEDEGNHSKVPVCQSDEVMTYVIPAKAGIQADIGARPVLLDACFRRNDGAHRVTGPTGVRR